VRAGPGGEKAAAGPGRGHLRASHADREQVVDMLKVAFVDGRLTKDELEARAGQAFAARTYGELAALIADLPAGMITVPSPREAARPRSRQAARPRSWQAARPRSWQAARPRSWQDARPRARPPMGKVVAGAALIVPLPALLMTVFLTSNDQLARVCLLVIPWYFVAWIVAGVQLLDWWLKPSHGQPPPGQHGRALVEVEPHSGIGDDLMLFEVREVPRAGGVRGPRAIRDAWWSPTAPGDRWQPANQLATA
jgi:hypothetical protein